MTSPINAAATNFINIACEKVKQWSKLAAPLGMVYQMPQKQHDGPIALR